jgi:glyoxylase-like metal-dependent hydrolase (beta-lactamase superfamily II)
MGILPTEVAWIILSHYHGDHIAGLKDFSRAKIMSTRVAYSFLTSLGRWRQALHAHFPSLLPADFLARWTAVEDHPIVSTHDLGSSYPWGYDLFGDGSVLGISLPGHVKGQLGLYLHDIKHAQRIFLVADACWSTRAFQELRLPNPIMKLMMANWSEYKRTIERLHELHRSQPDLWIIPSHCQQAIATWQTSFP